MGKKAILSKAARRQGTNIEQRLSRFACASACGWSVQPRDEQNPSTSFSRDGHSQLLERKSILECAVTNAVKRPPRAPEDVQCNMNRDPPFQRRARRFGSEIIGKKTNVKASVHAAAMSKVAEDCI